MARPMPPRPASPPPQPAAPAPSPAPQPAPPPGERVGVVTHYYGHVSVAIVRLESGMLRVGDTIHIRGHTTNFSQRIQSMEVEHAPASEVGPNDDFGLKVIAHVREHDVVYKVK
jgi:putative protease